jgi:hypothetical protein
MMALLTPPSASCFAFVLCALSLLVVSDAQGPCMCSRCEVVCLVDLTAANFFFFFFFFFFFGFFVMSIQTVMKATSFGGGSIFLDENQAYSWGPLV